MTGPPASKHEPDQANRLYALDTFIKDPHNTSTLCLLTLPSVENSCSVEKVDKSSVSDNTIHVSISPKHLSKKNFGAEVGSFTTNLKENEVIGGKNSTKNVCELRKSPSKVGVVEYVDKTETRNNVETLDHKESRKKHRQFSDASSAKKRVDNLSYRKPSFTRRTSRLYSFQPPAVISKHKNLKPRGSVPGIYTTLFGSKGGLSNGFANGQGALLLSGGVRVRSGCVRNGGRGRNAGSLNNESNSVLLTPSSSHAPSLASPLSLSPSSLSPYTAAFTFNTSPQSTTLGPSASISSSATTTAAISSLSSALSLSSTNSNRSREEFSFIIRGRGLSRAVDDSHHPPIETIVDDDLLNRTYVANIQKAYESQLNTPCSSGQTSPTIKESQSPLSVSHGGWTTGNTTERSSLDSSYSLDDFDKQAATTVGQHFAEIESLLFEGHSRESSVSTTTPPQADVYRECQEWVTQFPHLRVLGKQACPSKDMGFYHVPASSHVLSPSSPASRPTSSLLMDVTDHDLSINTSSDAQGLSLTGRSVSLCRLPLHSALAEGDRGDHGALSLSSSSSSMSVASSLTEEVLVEDGVYEDIIAVDYKNIYEENMENKKQITPRKRREGYPPITPNACVKDSVTSGAFDHIWQEIMSWMRELLMKYTAEISDSKHDVISFSPIHHHQHQTTPASREFSFILQSRQQPFPMQRSHTHVGSSTDRSIDGILHISSMPLQTRNQLGDVTESQVLATNRPGSSFNSQHPSRPMSTLRSQRGARGGRLAPLGDRSKTPNLEEEKPSRTVAIDALRVRRLPTISDPLPSPNFHRNGALPPLETERVPPRKLLQGTRASSAIDKDIRFLALKDKAHFLGEQARPNTTHTMRSETPFGGHQNRRSSTPLGNSITARNNLLSKQALDVRGNSLQVVGGMESAGHFHPDILEDTQEGPVDEVIRTHWNPPSQVSHNPYRRGKTSIR